MKQRSLIALCAAAAILLAVAACAPEVVPQGGGQGSGTDAWTAETDCAGCHIVEARSSGDAQADMVHHASLVCVTCHGTQDGKLEKAHKDYLTKAVPEKLSKTKVKNDVCSGCHDSGDLASKTAGLDVLIDKNGLTVNPHDLPATENHLDSVFCSSCHKLHSESSPGSSAYAVCANCHHAEVFECGTCH